MVLGVVLAGYGEGAESWALDTFNSVRFVCLQCIVGFWVDAKYVVAVGSQRATRALVDAVEGHAYAGELDRLAALASGGGEDDWFAFGEAAERIVALAALAPDEGARLRLSFRAVDAGYVVHMGPLRDWCLG